MRPAAFLILMLVLPCSSLLGQIEGEAPPAFVEKAPVPDAAARERFLQEIKAELYPDQYADLGNAASRAYLVKEMLATVGKVTDNTLKYVLLDQARDLSLRSLDIVTAFKAIDLLADSFVFDTRRRKVEALLSVAPHARAAAASPIAGVGLNLVDEAIDSDDWATAAEVMTALESVVAVTGNESMTGRWQAHRARITEHDAFDSALKKLESDPADSEANLCVGWYLCFVLRDFPQGTLHFARSSDAELGRVAPLERDELETPEKQRELGEIWYEVASGRTGTERRRALLRAEHWLAKAVPALANMDRLKAERRLEEIEKLLVELAGNEAGAEDVAGAPGELVADPPPSPEGSATGLQEWIDEQSVVLRAEFQKSAKAAMGRTKNLPDNWAIHVTQHKGVNDAVQPALRSVRDLGLLWLAAHSATEGGWSCASFDERCGNLSDDTICDGTGSDSFDVGVTGLGLLCFLRSGHGPAEGPYADVIRSGLEYLVDAQAADGDLSDPAAMQGTYDHILGTLALLEALPHDEAGNLRGPAESAVTHLLRSRNAGVAWRYQGKNFDRTKNPLNDVSVTAWAIQVLVKARDAHIDVDAEELAEALSDALAFVAEMTDPVTGRTGYFERGSPSARSVGKNDMWPDSQTEAMTAAAVLCRSLTDPQALQGNNRSMIKLGVERISALPPLWSDDMPGRRDFYFWRYGTEALARQGGPLWMKWKVALARVLIDNTITTGERAGSWAPQVDPWGSEGGRVYSTSMMVLAAIEAIAPHDGAPR
jgi:hypothetical protein